MDYDAIKLDNQLCFPLYACSREIIKQYKPFLDPLHLTYTQYIVFMVLWEKDDIPVNELGKKLHLDSGTLTPLLKKMETNGHIKRVRSQSDERMVRIILTPKGRTLKEEAVKIPEKMVQCIPLSTKDAVSLKQLLTQMLDGMHE